MVSWKEKLEKPVPPFFLPSLHPPVIHVGRRLPPKEAVKEAAKAQALLLFPLFVGGCGRV